MKDKKKWKEEEKALEGKGGLEATPFFRKLQSILKGGEG